MRRRPVERLSQSRRSGCRQTGLGKPWPEVAAVDARTRLNAENSRDLAEKPVERLSQSRRSGCRQTGLGEPWPEGM
jgi:hypothetical protein